MKLIVNVNQDWGIGANGDMLVHISADLKRFKALTLGSAVVMGYATLMSLPGSKPLEGRDNYVLSRKKGLKIEGAVVVPSIDALWVALNGREDVFVIGGESIYRQLLDYCDYAYITKSSVEAGVDTFFPDLDKDENWIVAEQGETLTEKGVEFRYIDYKRIR